jgi:hypothetical protein
VISELRIIARGLGKLPQVSNRMISMAYYSLITGLGLAAIGNSYPSTLRTLIVAEPWIKIIKQREMKTS